jgi:CheY-like chemotaxis protein
MNDVHNNDQYSHRPGRARSNSSRHAEELNRVLYTIAIVDQQQRTLFFPYFVGEVDEEPQLREVTCSILSVMGYTVTEAASGEEAVEMLRRKPVELVILDMLMAPGWNGRRTYEEILRINPRQKAILVSGYSENEDVRACFALGVGAFLKKPYTLEQLCGAVRDELFR